MSSRRDEYTYAKEFIGNLRGEFEPVPVQVNTRLRVETNLTPSEVQEYNRNVHGVPKYVFGQGGKLPLHPSLQAMGRHYFTW